MLAPQTFATGDLETGRSTYLRALLWAWAQEMTPLEIRQNQLVERTILIACDDPDLIDDTAIEAALHAIMRGLQHTESAKAALAEATPVTGR